MFSKSLSVVVLLSLSLSLAAQSGALAQLPGKTTGPGTLVLPLPGKTTGPGTLVLPLPGKTTGPGTLVLPLPGVAARAMVKRPQAVTTWPRRQAQKQAPLPAAKPQPADGVCLCHDASRLMDEGHYGQSKDMYLRYIITLKSEQGEYGYDVGRMYKNVYLNCKNLGDYKGAEKYLNMAMAIMQRAPQERAELIAELTADRSDLADEQKQMDKALAFGAQSVRMFARAKAEPSEAYGFAHSNYAYCLQETGQEAKAEKHYLQALAIYRADNDDKDSTHSAVVLTNLGNIYFDRGDFKKALSQYQARFDFELGQDKTDADDLKRGAYNLARTQIKDKHFIKGIDTYKQALARLEQAFPPLCHEVEALAQTAADQLAGADCYASAVPFYEKLLACCQSDEGDKGLHVPAALNNLAFAYFKSGSYAEARPLMERALALMAAKPHGQDYIEAKENYKKLLAAIDKRHGERISAGETAAI